ncbi:MULTISPECIES: DUF4864 domain-containing protein [Leisingera]|jgi:hypothetical protein|uniref:DUF4864 domain-containing protein n=1 Tax=Leisingera TaxID=191028 RepID=UPI00114E48F0|nr:MULTISPECIES: DUF4864 domain-containing protein [Leisingera]QDI74758.1 DUF4864 domain-containing protein [Leisingera aquaemixtae]
MRSVLFAGVSVFLLTFPVLAQREPVAAVTGSQFEILLINDAETALTYACPNIRRISGPPERVARMVRRGAPMVCRPAGARYPAQRAAAGCLWRRPMVPGRNGAVHPLYYQMVNLKISR